MIHYHGTPVTPRDTLRQLGGKHFCVSHAEPRDADVCLSIGQSVMWDNGAFTKFTQGKETDFNAFYRWVEPKLGHPHWGVVPDVINGEVSDQLELLNQWPFPRSLGAPVWHLHLPISHLMELVDGGWNRVCFGSSGQYWKIGSEAWERRVDEAFNELAKNGPLPFTHMMRGLALAGKRWPFGSADSTNVARNYSDRDENIEFMARTIDTVQCPVSWNYRPLQSDLLATA